MMAVWNIQRGLKIINPGENFVGIGGMPPHNDEFFLGQFRGFVQDGVRDAHFADIMQQGAPPQVNQFLALNSHFRCQAYRHVCYALIVMSRFLFP